MANATYTKPQHIARLFYSYWDGTAWSAHEEITDSFLNDPYTSHSGTVSGIGSLIDNLVEKDRFILYCGSYVNGVWTPAAGTIDKIAMASLSQTSGLTLKTYADDSIALGSVPTTLIDTHVQAADTFPLDTKDELITFTEQTKECFMVEREGIESYISGSSVNLLKNSGFETGDLTSWTTTGTVAVLATTATVGEGSYYADLSSSGATLAQTIATSSGGGEFQISFNKYRVLGQMASIDVDGVVGGSYLSSSPLFGSDHEYNFTISSSETSITVKITLNSVLGDLTIDETFLKSLELPTYTGSPLDTGAIVFGGDAVTTAENFNNDPEQDDSRKTEDSNSGSRSFAVTTNDLRREVLQYTRLTTTEKDTLEHLTKTLVDGLCIYQRDGADSTDTEKWFIGLFGITPNTGTTITKNSMQVTVRELVARG